MVVNVLGGADETIIRDIKFVEQRSKIPDISSANARGVTPSSRAFCAILSPCSSVPV
jgi:hypothetical protein